MKIKFLKNHKSIEKFQEKIINDFSILTGLNGSGKTHILEGIKNGSIQVDNINVNQISYFNFSSFLLQNQPAANATSISQLKKQAWVFLQQRQKNFAVYDKNIKNFLTVDNISPYIVNEENIKENQIENYQKSLNQVSNFIQEQSKGNVKQLSLLKSAFHNTLKPLSEITEDDFFELSSFDYLDYHLLNNLSEIFIEHQKKIALGTLSVETGGLGLSDEKIENLKKHSPWNLINSIFEQYDLSHRVNHPNFSAGDLIRQPAITFQVTLTVNSKNIQFADLSSGEKVLCALAITVFQDTKSDFPRLLLLDEIDATLHPSMIKETIKVIENIFVKNGSKVILATHSPTTIAHALENSIFEIKKGTLLDKIIEINKSKALNILTAGFLTFEEGIGLLQKPKPQIYLEGTTDIDYWNKTFELFENEYKGLRNSIDMVDGNGGESKKNIYKFNKGIGKLSFIKAYFCF